MHVYLTNFVYFVSRSNKIESVLWLLKDITRVNIMRRNVIAVIALHADSADVLLHYKTNVSY